MRRVRVIPVLTIQKEKLVKTIKFKKPNYIGDPINAVKIFNDKEVDEIIILDISATKERRVPNYDKIREMASEAFMPLTYGGGINKFEQIETIFKLGVEKVALNSTIANNIALITKAVKRYGSQSIVVSIDIKNNFLNKNVIYSNSGTKKVTVKLLDYIQKIEKAGAGEIFLTSINKDGTYTDYDYELIKLVSSNCSIPIVCGGGANSIESFKNAIVAGASAVAAGSFFVYSSPSKGVLINYPSQSDLTEKLFSKL